MELIIGILLLPLGVYLFRKSVKDAKTEPGMPHSAIKLAILALGLIAAGVILIYNYFKN